jgi:magnesium-protoporphyrin O-methyltransferase
MTDMPTATYQTRRGELETYFDRTAVKAWERLTSDAPVGRIRATVRKGREEMRNTLLSWLPGDLATRRVLDAGCGTGALAVEAARRGADVVAVDISPTLVELGRARTEGKHGAGQVTFHVGDMLDEGFGRFDHIVAMDILIHYQPADVTRVLGMLARRTTSSIVFTFAPRTKLLAAMHNVGKLFPRGDRAPSIVPVAPAHLRALIEADPALRDWTIGREKRVAGGFYISQALELRRK